MYDFVKLQLPPHYARKLRECELLDFCSQFSNGTGEVFPKEISLYPKGSTEKTKLLTFTINGNYVEVKGSLHKYWQGGTNYKKYTFPELIDTIDSLQTIFGIEPHDAIVRNLEIGFNMTLSKTTAQEFLENCVMHSTKPFGLNLFEGKGYKKTFYYWQYEVKVYNKGLHQLQTENILRFEKKLKKMESFGLVTLHDLTTPDIVNRAKNVVVDIAKLLIVSEPHIKMSSLTKPQKRLVSDWANPNYLSQLVKTKSRKFKCERAQYKKLVPKYCENSIYKDFLEKLDQQIFEFQPDK
jgi:hypothetical protein